MRTRYLWIIVFLLAKQYLYSCRQNKYSPSIRVLNSKINTIFLFETMIAKSKNMLETTEGRGFETHLGLKFFVSSYGWFFTSPFTSFIILIQVTRHFDFAREIRSRWFSKCIVGLFWETNLPPCSKCVPQNSPTIHFDNHFDPVSRATSKWRLLTLSLFCYRPSRDCQMRFIPEFC